MLGESGIGLYVAYALISALVIVIVVMFARVVIAVSLLWIAPVAAVLRWIRRGGRAERAATGPREEVLQTPPDTG